MAFYTSLPQEGPMKGVCKTEVYETKGETINKL